jgi:hypothetical protein
LIWTKYAPAFAALSPSMGQVYFNIATASIIANDKTNPAFVQDGILALDAANQGGPGMLHAV